MQQTDQLELMQRVAGNLFLQNSIKNDTMMAKKKKLAFSKNCFFESVA